MNQWMKMNSTCFSLSLNLFSSTTSETLEGDQCIVNSDANNNYIYFILVILNYTYSVLIENKLNKVFEMEHLSIYLLDIFRREMKKTSRKTSCVRTTFFYLQIFVNLKKNNEIDTNEINIVSALWTWIIHSAAYTKRMWHLIWAQISYTQMIGVIWKAIQSNRSAILWSTRNMYIVHTSEWYVAA